VVCVSLGNIEIKFHGPMLREEFCLPFEVAAAQCQDDVSSNPIHERKIRVFIKPHFISTTLVKMYESLACIVTNHFWGVFKLFGSMSCYLLLFRHVM
jgi:hypothetical protein